MHIRFMRDVAVIVDVSKGLVNLLEVDDMLLCKVAKLSLPSLIVDHELGVVVAEEGLEDLYDGGIVCHPLGLQGSHHEHLDQVLGHHLLQVDLSIDDVPLRDLELVEHQLLLDSVSPSTYPCDLD